MNVSRLGIGRVLMAVLATLALACASPLAMAKDVIHLKNGKVYEGEIQYESETGIRLVVTIGTVKNILTFTSSEIDQIERGVSDGEDDDDAVHARVIPDGATRIAFITLEEMVGPYFNKDAIERSIDILDDLPDAERPDVVVLWIDSGGGALFELMKIVEYLEEDAKPKFRIVSWIRSAISAAAMSAWVTEEIYMMREGNIGACTGFSSQGGSTKAMEGRGLEMLLAEMEQVSNQGRKDPYIMRAMQVYMTLSCDIDEDGTITWYNDDSGEYLVSPQDEILTFHSLDAVKFGVADGIADTKEELASLLGFTEWVEVGHKAAEYQVTFRKNVARAETAIDELWGKLNIARDAAGAAPTRREAKRQIGVALNYLDKMQAWVRKAPSLETYKGLTPEVFRAIRKEIRDQMPS